MLVKFCLDCSRPLMDDDDEDARRAIAADLHMFDCGDIDVPELGPGDWWVFQLQAADRTGAEIAGWVRKVMSTIEGHTRRLADDEWVVIMDRKGVFASAVFCGGD